MGNLWVRDYLQRNSDASGVPQARFDSTRQRRLCSSCEAGAYHVPMFHQTSIPLEGAEVTGNGVFPTTTPPVFGLVCSLFFCSKGAQAKARMATRFRHPASTTVASVVRTS